MKGKTGLEEGAIWVAGCMSGTSLDGVDAAAILTDGEQVLQTGQGRYRAYTTSERDLLRASLGKWPGDEGVSSVDALLLDSHAELLSGFKDVQLVGFHGQTLAHDPGGRGTHQAGDGAALSQRAGLPVVWDLRAADVAAGGQGAPLAPVYHFALARMIGAKTPLAFLNLGGVGNMTWIDPSLEAPFASGAMVAFDTGPANAPLNDLMQRRLGRAVDQDGALASNGTPDKQILNDLLAHPYLSKPPPKSLDRDDFDFLSRAVDVLGDADAAATLTAAVAETVAQGVRQCPQPPDRVLVTGGGRRNQTMMAMLAAALPCDVAPVEDAGLDGDMLEAQAFAFMAVRSVRGLPISGPSTTGAPHPLTGGRLSFP